MGSLGLSELIWNKLAWNSTYMCIYIYYIYMIYRASTRIFARGCRDISRGCTRRKKVKGQSKNIMSGKIPADADRYRADGCVGRRQLTEALIYIWRIWVSPVPWVEYAMDQLDIFQLRHGWIRNHLAIKGWMKLLIHNFIPYVIVDVIAYECWDQS